MTRAGLLRFAMSWQWRTIEFAISLALAIVNGLEGSALLAILFAFNSGLALHAAVSHVDGGCAE